MSADEQVGLLLDEQQAAEAAQQAAHGPTLRYVRENLQELTGNAVPLPEGATEAWIWYLYRVSLQGEIDQLSRRAEADQCGPAADLPGPAAAAAAAPTGIPREALHRTPREVPQRAVGAERSEASALAV